MQICNTYLFLNIGIIIDFVIGQLHCFMIKCMNLDHRQTFYRNFQLFPNVQDLAYIIKHSGIVDSIDEMTCIAAHMLIF